MQKKDITNSLRRHADGGEFIIVRVQPVHQPVADQVQAQHREDDRQAWKERDPPSLEYKELARMDDVAPAGRRGGDSGSEEAEPRLRDDGAREDRASLSLDRKSVV